MLEFIAMSDDESSKGKALVGKKIAELVQDGQVIGVGTGSTVAAALNAISERVKKDNLNVSFVPTSYQSTWQLEQLGLSALDFAGDWKIDWSFDGADAVDASGNIVKGKGAAMLREKILAANSPKYYILVDDSKVCEDILDHVNVPIEVHPASTVFVSGSLKRLGASNIDIRMAEKKHGPVITEAGNVILDVNFKSFKSELEDEIKQIVGVVESGLFIGFADQIYVASGGKVEELL